MSGIFDYKIVDRDIAAIFEINGSAIFALMCKTDLRPVIAAHLNDINAVGVFRHISVKQRLSPEIFAVAFDFAAAGEGDIFTAVAMQNAEVIISDTAFIRRKRAAVFDKKSYI